MWCIIDHLIGQWSYELLMIFWTHLNHTILLILFAGVAIDVQTKRLNRSRTDGYWHHPWVSQILVLMLRLDLWGAGMAQWWEHSPPTNVARVQFSVSASYVGWVCSWFSSLLRGFFSGYSGFSPSTKTNTFVQLGTHGHLILKRIPWELFGTPWLNRLLFYWRDYNKQFLCCSFGGGRENERCLL